MKEIRWHARAGQGAKTAAQLFATAMVQAGKSAQAFPEYGPERRGAPIRAYTRVDDRPIRRHDSVIHPDVVVVLEPSLMSELDVREGLAPGGFVLLNAESPLDGGPAICVPASRLAAARGSKFANLVMVGALAAALGEPSAAEVATAAADLLGKKARRADVEGAVEEGYRYLSSGGRQLPQQARVAASESLNGGIRLQDWLELAAGGAVLPGGPRLRTGGWRTGTKPSVDLSRCVNCLLCWLYCPDSAVLLDGTIFAGFDFDVCKGCEICAEICPVGAVEMVADDGG